MAKIIALFALTIVALFVLLRLVSGKNRVRDRYIRRDYEKFKQLDARIEEETTIEPSAQQKTPNSIS
jgi:hypothetical protein